jgi:cadmium resistance protein CadD (predicted permease)
MLLVMTGIWCLAAYLILQVIARMVQQCNAPVLPIVLIALGSYILISSDAFSVSPCRDRTSIRKEPAHVAE